MKTKAGLFASLALVLALSILSSCNLVVPSGVTVEKRFSPGNFSGVAADSAFQCSIVQGSTCSVLVQADQNYADYVDVSTTGPVLTVRMKQNFSMTGQGTLKAFITMPAIDSLALGGAASASVIGFAAQRPLLNVSLDGASALNWFGGSVVMATVSVASASQATFSGFSTQGLTATVSGASSLLGGAGNTSTDVLSLNVSGVSSLSWDVRTLASGSVSGVSNFRYGLNPNLTGVVSSGVSSIQAR